MRGTGAAVSQVLSTPDLTLLHSAASCAWQEPIRDLFARRQRDNDLRRKRSESPRRAARELYRLTPSVRVLRPERLPNNADVRPCVSSQPLGIYPNGHGHLQPMDKLQASDQFSLWRRVSQSVHPQSITHNLVHNILELLCRLSCVVRAWQHKLN